MVAIQVNKSYLVELTSLLWHYFSMEFCWAMVSRMSPFWSSTRPFGTMMLFPLCQRRHPQATAGTCQVHSDQAPVQVDGITTMESRHHLRVLPGTEESIWPGYNSPIYTTPRATSTPQGWNWPDGSTRWRNWERMLSTLSLTPSTITMRRFSTSSSTRLPMPEQSPSMLKSRLSELSSEVLQTFHSSSSD